MSHLNRSLILGIDNCKMYCLLHSCPIYSIRNGSQKGWRFATDRDGLPGSYDQSRIVTDCLDRHTLSHVAKRDSGSELQVHPPLKKLARRVVKFARTATIRDGSWRSVTAVKQPCTLMMSLTQINRRKRCVNTVNIPRSKKGAHKHNETPKHPSGKHK